MKKLLSVLFAVCILLGTSISAFAAQPDYKALSSEIHKEIQDIVDYLGTQGYMVKNSYTVDDAMDLFYLLESGAEINNSESFVQAVKENIKANGGKLVTAYGEKITTYAAAIQIFYDLGLDPTDVDGVNLYSLMSALDPTVAPYSPYEYNVIINVANDCDNDFSKKLCDTFIKDCYVEGKGMNYYGFGCDNTAFMLSSLSQYFNPNDDVTDRYDDVKKDCLNVIKSYKVGGGYCYSFDYGTDPNGDSTAVALMAYSVYMLYDLGDLSNDEFLALCNEAYSDLQGFKSATAGAYTYMKDGDNVYATADALRGLMYYSRVVDFLALDLDDDEESEPETTETTDKGEIVSSNDTETDDSTAVKSPATSASTAEASIAVAFFAAALTTAVIRKRTK